MHNARTMRTTDLMRRAGAWAPPAMSLAALAVVLVHIALFGTARAPDEGPTAHIFQLLMAVQLPVAAVFAIQWLPRAPRAALQVLALQVAAALAALAPVFCFSL